MPGSKTANPALPFALAMYIATSALRTDVGGALGRFAGAGDADAGADRHVVLTDEVGRTKLAGQPLGHGQRPLQVRGVRGEDRELIATEACDEVAVAHRVREPFRHCLEQAVPGSVTKGVIDDLEVIEVDEEHRSDRVAIAQLVAVEDALEVELERAPVGCAGERVALGEVLDVTQQHGIAQVQGRHRAHLLEHGGDTSIDAAKHA